MLPVNKMRSTGCLVLGVTLLTLSSLCPAAIAISWNIFSSSSKGASHRERGPAGATPRLDGTVADFKIDGANDPRGVKLLEGAQRRIAVAGPGSCWNEAYRGLFASCADIMADKERQSRLAWRLSSCYQEDSGRPPLPPCDERSKMVHCRKRLSEFEGKVYLEFFLETNTLCHQLQAEAFKHSTERLVNELSRASKSAYEKLEAIEERSEQIMQESAKLHDTMSSIRAQTEHLAEASKNVGARIGDVLEQSRAVSEQSREIASAQAELKEGQAEMKHSIEAGMARVEESYRALGDEMDRLKEETMGIERAIKVVGDAMSSKMQDLQSTADHIGSVAGKSLENQMELLNGQAKAMQGLRDLHSFQAQALQDSREALQKLAHFGQQQQEVLLSRQDQIRQAHDHLMQNSQSILRAQEEFSSKQANIFAALEKLQILHNAILVESRFIKAFFFYCCITFLVYLLTSAKQTFAIRGHLYFGLCITLMLEIGLIKLGADDFSKQFWILSKVLLVRSTFLAAAVAQILHSIFTFRDYEVLNHQLLQTLVEKVRAIEDNAGGGHEIHTCSTSSDGSLGDYSWVFDELQDEVDSKIDPDFVLPKDICRNNREEVGGNSSITPQAKRYNLRSRITPR